MILDSRNGASLTPTQSYPCDNNDSKDAKRQTAGIREGGGRKDEEIIGALAQQQQQQQQQLPPCPTSSSVPRPPPMSPKSIIDRFGDLHLHHHHHDDDATLRHHNDYDIEDPSDSSFWIVGGVEDDTTNRDADEDDHRHDVHHIFNPSATMKVNGSSTRDINLNHNDHQELPLLPPTTATGTTETSTTATSTTDASSQCQHDEIGVDFTDAPNNAKGILPDDVTCSTSTSIPDGSSTTRVSSPSSPPCPPVTHRPPTVPQHDWHDSTNSIPSESGRFGACSISYLSHNVPQHHAIRVMEEAIRIVVPGGRLYVVDYDGQTISKLPYQYQQMLQRVSQFDPYEMEMMGMNEDDIQQILLQIGRSQQCYSNPSTKTTATTTMASGTTAPAIVVARWVGIVPTSDARD